MIIKALIFFMNTYMRKKYNIDIFLILIFNLIIKYKVIETRSA